MGPPIVNFRVASQIFQHQFIGAAECTVTLVLVLVVEHARHVAIHHHIVFGIQIQRLAVF